MRLRDYDARFIDYTGRTGEPNALRFRCPCSENCEAIIVVAFTPDFSGNVVESRFKPWQRVNGTTVDDLTLAPSINLFPSDMLLKNGERFAHPGWHGFLTNGELRTC